MSFTAMYRKQHEDLLALATDLHGLLNPATLKDSGMQARSTLSKLAGKLNVHLAQEDKSLYPKLLASNNPEVQKTAKQFAVEMGGIGVVLKAYLDKWPTHIQIQDDPQTFIMETTGIIQALGQRIEKENTVLYPLADA